MKKIFIAMVVIMLLLFTTSTAHADRAVNTLVGIGAMAIGSVILHDIQPYNHRHDNYRPYIAPQRVWMPPVRIKVWTPGYYSQYGIFVRGGWRTVTDRPGHYVYGMPDDYGLQFRYYR
jgi:hypothetical protein